MNIFRFRSRPTRSALGSALLLASLGFAPALSAQIAPDLNEGVRLESNPSTGALAMSWWGRYNRLYLAEGSEDLLTWTALPVLEIGLDATLTYGMATNAPRYFLRLRFSDDPDYDHDGLSNLEELALGSSPTSADSDGDGIPDGWERAHGLDPKNPADASATAPGGQSYRTLYQAEQGLLDRTAAASLPAGMALVLRTAGNNFHGIKPTGEIAVITAP